MLGPLSLAALALALGTPIGRVDDPPKPPARPSEPRGSFPGEDPAPAFVPKTPRTAEDRAQIEALRDYATARALEDRRLWVDAIAKYEEALKKRPDSIAVLRRLCGLCFALGRSEQAIGYSRRVIDIEPADVTTQERLLLYYLERRHDNAAAESLLKSILANPKLSADSAGAIVARRNLGDLCSDLLNQPEKAADLYAQVVEALDKKDASKLSSADQRGIFKGDEARSYIQFGDAFLKVNRFDLAVRAYQRGLAYDAEHARLPALLAEALLSAGRPAEALATLEPYLRKQPAGLSAFALLGKVLTALKRGDEFVPRLEAAARDDPKNIPLQLALSEAYRKAGQGEKADAALRALLGEGAGDPEVLGALADALYREKKTDELLKLLGDSLGKEKGPEAIRPTLEAILKDPEFLDRLLDAGIRLQSADPPALSTDSRKVLSYLATQSKKLDKRVALQRLVIRQDPSVKTYRELFQDLWEVGRFGEVAAAVEEMMGRFPDEKGVENLVLVARAYSLDNKNDKAVAAVAEAVQVGPDDPRALQFQAYLSGKLGKYAEAIAQYKAILAKFAENVELTNEIHADLSAVYVNQEKFSEGEKELEEVLAKDPDDERANNDLGYLYADQGKNLDRAEMMIRKALEERPDNAAYLDSLGWVLYKRNKLQEAIDPLEKAAKDASTDPTIHDHLGDVYFSLKEVAKARAAWETAEKIAANQEPPDKKLPTIRKKLAALGRRGLESTTAGPMP